MSDLSEPPKLYRELGKKQRWLRGAITAFTIYHVVAMLVGGAVGSVKQKVALVFEGYDEGLRMTNSWGMFGKPPTTTHVTVEADLADGSNVVLSTTRAADRTLFERLRDSRIRKIQAKLAEPADRVRFGPAYLDYFCRLAWTQHGAQVTNIRATNHFHETRNDDGSIRRKPSSLPVLARPCTGGHPGRLWIPPAPKGVSTSENEL